MNRLFSAEKVCLSKTKVSMERIWYEDPGAAFGTAAAARVLPTGGANLAGQLNSVVRLAVYVSAGLALALSDSRWLFLGVAAALGSVAVNEHYRKRVAGASSFLEGAQLDLQDGAVCARPTTDNPFMNPSVFDFGHGAERAPACAATPEVRSAVERGFNARLWRDAGDVWNKNASQRQFYTVPNTRIPNDQMGFALWRAGSAAGPTCKEKGIACVARLQDVPHRLATQGGTVRGS